MVPTYRPVRGPQVLNLAYVRTSTSTCATVQLYQARRYVGKLKFSARAKKRAISGYRSCLYQLYIDFQYIARCPPPDAGDGAERHSSPSAPTASAPGAQMYQSKYNRYDKLFAERVFVLEMVKNDWGALEHATAEFCADREIVHLSSLIRAVWFSVRLGWFGVVAIEGVAHCQPAP